jgi:hypothetical protein
MVTCYEFVTNFKADKSQDKKMPRTGTSPEHLCPYIYPPYRSAHLLSLIHSIISHSPLKCKTSSVNMKSLANS